jgi:hypothetical protein
MMSDMTVKYFEARLREGQNFDYLRWFRRLQEEKAQAKIIAAPISLGEPLISEINDLAQTSNHQNTRLTLAPAVTKTMLPNLTLRRTNHRTTKQNARHRLRRRLKRVCNAWNVFQSNRGRDAVYGYLEAVFALVDRYKGRRRTKKLLRHALTFSGLSFEEPTEPLGALIRCTSDRGLDNKTISKWSRALRYVAHCQVPSQRLKTFMKQAGGVNACAERYARYRGRDSL